MEYHPAYHIMLREGIEAGISAAAWSGVQGGHVLHAALELLLAEVEPSVCCPITMTYAAPAALKHQPDVAQGWLPKIVGRKYDAASRPAGEKQGVTIGMALTESRAARMCRQHDARRGDGRRQLPAYRPQMVLFGADVGCVSDARLRDRRPHLLSRAALDPDGKRNGIHIMRLKDKVGDRANASSEIEYHGAHTVRIGEKGRGVATILEMVHHTRPRLRDRTGEAYMRSASPRRCGTPRIGGPSAKRLIEQPLMRHVLADLAIESEASTALASRVARSFDEAAGERRSGPLLSRIATPVAKYYLNKRVAGHVAECMECHGGAGYVEEWPIARLYRQAPLNGIWEGSSKRDLSPTCCAR